MKNKKPYTKPEMQEIKINVQSHLLCGSADNAYWGGCWEGPSEEDGWYKKN